MINEVELGKQIEVLLQEVKGDFEAHPDKFLTEEDARVHVFKTLSKNDYLSSNKLTKNNGVSIPLHAEIRWYGRNASKRLNIRSDIVIIDPAQIRTKGSPDLPLPTKEFHFNNAQAVIEIKLRRGKRCTEGKWRELIQEDVVKLITLKNYMPDARFFLFILDKIHNGQPPEIPSDIFLVWGKPK